MDEEATSLKHIPTDYVPPTNDMALVSFISGLGGWALAFLGICPLASHFGLCFAALSYVAWATAIGTGVMARNQAAKRREEGRDLAHWGIVAGISGIIIVTIMIILLALLILFGVMGMGFLSFLVE